ncbi:DUF551 domain-containing protein [Salmonella enterica]|nr:DUF551 domain-containing protein [Salmonella enterica]EHP4289089.1 DUF551 domain-containing protein [Salmonella enterica]ELP6468871.1 DUF551 domain-containing protein [Salmonella enterica]
MTTITREQLHERARRKVKELEFAITQSAFTSIRDGLEEELELARIALVSLDAEPVAWTDEQELRDVEKDGLGYLFTVNPITPNADHRRVILLYRHAQPAPVDKEFIPKNLDKALGVVGVALPESKEEFNFQIERWIQRLIDRVIRYADEFKEQPAPVVPPAIEPDYKVIKSILPTANPDEYACCIAADMWNACRAAMLQGVEQPQNARQNIPENIPDGNSPAIPDDWVMVPKEPTQAMIKAWLSEVANFRGHAVGYKAALAAAPQREVK